MGVVLKRAGYFITCKGRMMYPVKMDQDVITRMIIGEEKRQVWDIEHHNIYRQMSLFDDYHMTVPPAMEDLAMTVSGSI